MREQGGWSAAGHEQATHLAAPSGGVYLLVDVYNHTAERIPPYRPNRLVTLDDIEEWVSERNKGAVV